MIGEGLPIDEFYLWFSLVFDYYLFVNLDWRVWPVGGGLGRAGRYSREVGVYFWGEHKVVIVKVVLRVERRHAVLGTIQVKFDAMIRDQITYQKDAIPLTLSIAIGTGLTGTSVFRSNNRVRLSSAIANPSWPTTILAKQKTKKPI
jgi:hypothetical protein